jgi:hypothetical protein
MPPTVPLGYYWGDDSYGVNHAPDVLATRLAADGPPLEKVRLTGVATSAAEIGYALRRGGSRRRVRTRTAGRV